MFALGDNEWPGASKLNEECGELIQVIGKLMGSRGDINHWSYNLRDKFHEELGDVLAAITFLIDYNDIDEDAVCEQSDRKYKQFVEWHLAGDPLD